MATLYTILNLTITNACQKRAYFDVSVLNSFAPRMTADPPLTSITTDMKGGKSEEQRILHVNMKPSAHWSVRRLAGLIATKHSRLYSTTLSFIRCKISVSSHVRACVDWDICICMESHPKYLSRQEIHLLNHLYKTLLLMLYTVSRQSICALFSLPTLLCLWTKVKEFPDKPLTVSAGKLLCTVCRELVLKATVLKLHFKSRKHKKGREQLGHKGKQDMVIAESCIQQGRTCGWWNTVERCIVRLSEGSHNILEGWGTPKQAGSIQPVLEVNEVGPATCHWLLAFMQDTTKKISLKVEMAAVVDTSRQFVHLQSGRQWPAGTVVLWADRRCISFHSSSSLSKCIHKIM